MRPGQNKRLRGRSNHGRKGPNPLTRSFESNGPDVKVRGTAQHIAEKYLQLARDAQSSGDPVMAENYLQHAEHYYRVITAAHQAQQQAMGFGNRPPQEIEDEDDGIEEDDRFASVADRLPQPPQQAAPQPNFGGQPGGGQPYAGPQQGGGGQGGGNQPFGERQPYGNQRPWRENRQENRPDNRQENRQDPRPDNRQDARQGNPQDNRQDNRQEGRPEGRPDNRGENRGEMRDQRPDYRAGEGRSEGGDRPDRQNVNGGQPWRGEPRRPRENRPEASEAEESVGLPAFITGSRPSTESAVPPAQPDLLGGGETGDAGYHLRPRRRRRGRPADGTEGGGETEGASQDENVPVTE